MTRIKIRDANIQVQGVSIDKPIARNLSDAEFFQVQHARRWRKFFSIP